MGVAAAMEAQKESCDTVGFLGGQIGFLIGKFEAGYTEGVHAVDPDINVLVEYIGDSTAAFNDAAAGDQLSTAMYDDGACIIYHAAGASGAGLFTAAVKADKIAIGVDSDQYELVSDEQKPHVMTSMLKRVDTAVYDAIVAANDDSLEGGVAEVFGIAEDGISYSIEQSRADDRGHRRRDRGLQGADPRRVDHAAVLHRQAGDAVVRGSLVTSR